MSNLWKLHKILKMLTQFNKQLMETTQNTEKLAQV